MAFCNIFPQTIKQRQQKTNSVENASWAKLEVHDILSLIKNT